MPALLAAGAAPTAAMATAVVPLAPAGMMEEDLYQMMAGALSTLRAAGCALVGGHSSEGADMALGEWRNLGVLPAARACHSRRCDWYVSNLSALLRLTVQHVLIYCADLQGFRCMAACRARRYCQRAACSQGRQSY